MLTFFVSGTQVCSSGVVSRPGLHYLYWVQFDLLCANRWLTHKLAVASCWAGRLAGQVACYCQEIWWRVIGWGGRVETFLSCTVAHRRLAVALQLP